MDKTSDSDKKAELDKLLDLYGGDIAALEQSIAAKKKTLHSKKAIQHATGPVLVELSAVTRRYKMGKHPVTAHTT